MLMRRYEHPAKLLALFNPDHQVEYTKDQRRAYLGAAPTLGMVGKAFGDDIAESWLSIQLNNLAEFSGCKTKFSVGQMNEIVGLISAQYGYLKLTELMDFFRRFKSGEYGKFYGAVDPMAITCAMKDFCADRAALLARFAQEDAARQKQEDPEYKAYVRRYREHERMATYYCRHFRSDDFTLEDFAEIWWLFNIGYESTERTYDENMERKLH